MPEETDENKPLGVLSHDKLHNDFMEKEREISDKKYAPAWQGAIIVAFCGAILLLFTSGVFYLLMKGGKP